MKNKRNAGFTIIELMIATVVFTIVLLVISGAIVQIGRLYYKGITQARTQSAARGILDSITQSIQFNGGDITPADNINTAPLASPDGKSQAVCIGSQHYMYTFGQQRVGNKHSLVTRNIGGGCLAEKAVNMSSASTVPGSEMLGENMRLANLVVLRQNSKTYAVLARVVYGENDLLCSKTLQAAGRTGADCSSNDAMSASDIASARDLQCKIIRAGSQFCAVAELSTIVERRLNE